jgi:hypothetical protein
VGGAIVVGGELLKSGSGLGGELGHVSIDPNGAECPCGSRGCLERVVGQEALLNTARLDAEVGTSIGVPDGGVTLLAESAERGDQGDHRCPDRGRAGARVRLRHGGQSPHAQYGCPWRDIRVTFRLAVDTASRGASGESVCGSLFGSGGRSLGAGSGGGSQGRRFADPARRLRRSLSRRLLEVLTPSVAAFVSVVTSRLEPFSKACIRKRGTRLQ